MAHDHDFNTHHTTIQVERENVSSGCQANDKSQGCCWPKAGTS